MQLQQKLFEQVRFGTCTQQGPLISASALECYFSHSQGLTRSHACKAFEKSGLVLWVQSSLASMPSQSPPPEVGGSGHGLSLAEAARAASPAWAASCTDSAKSADARAVSPAGSVRSADARAASPARPSGMGSQPCRSEADALMGPPPRVHPLPGHRLQSGLSHRGRGPADSSANGVVPRVDAPTRSRESAGLTLPPPEVVAASVRYCNCHHGSWICWKHAPFPHYPVLYSLQKLILNQPHFRTSHIQICISKS